MTATFNGISFGDLVLKYGLSELPRRVSGPNEGVAISGKAIDDTLAIKYDPTFTLWPLTTEQMGTVWQMAAVKGFAPLVYSDPRGVARTINARLTVSSPAIKALEFTNEAYYNGVVLTFEEQ